MSMGRIFKTFEDDATEATLRALHTQNQLDTFYERTFSWVKTIVASIVTAFVVSYLELKSGASLWENTAEAFTNWLRGLLS